MFNFFFPESCTVWSIPGKMKFPRSVPFFLELTQFLKMSQICRGSAKLAPEPCRPSRAQGGACRLLLGELGAQGSHRSTHASAEGAAIAAGLSKSILSLSLFAIQLSLIISSFNWHYYSLTYVLFWGVCVCYILINVYVTLVFTWTALIYLLLALRTFYCFV